MRSAAGAGRRDWPPSLEEKGRGRGGVSFERKMMQESQRSLREAGAFQVADERRSFP